jgi:hypothetical protein
MIGPLHRRERSALILLVLTATGVALSRGPLAISAVGTILVVIAVIKARLVVLDYFGFRGVPGPWRAALLAWIALVATTALIPSIALLSR